MNIGHARRKITPQGDIYLIGYRNLPNRLEPATGVHDDVFANAILFQQDDREVFLFNADVLEFEESMAEEVKTMLAERYGIDRDCVLLSATHDHTSIVAYHRSWWTGKFNEDYYRWFLDHGARDRDSVGRGLCRRHCAGRGTLPAHDVLYGLAL